MEHGKEENRTPPKKKTEKEKDKESMILKQTGCVVSLRMGLPPGDAGREDGHSFGVRVWWKAGGMPFFYLFVYIYFYKLEMATTSTCSLDNRKTQEGYRVLKNEFL